MLPQTRRHAGAVEQVGGERRGRRLAVAAGDGDDRRGQGTCSRTPAANSSISETTGTAASATSGVALGTPGDRAIRSTAGEGHRRKGRPPVRPRRGGARAHRRWAADCRGVGNAHAAPSRRCSHYHQDRQPGSPSRHQENAFLCVAEFHVFIRSFRVVTARPAPA